MYQTTELKKNLKIIQRPLIIKNLSDSYQNMVRKKSAAQSLLSSLIAWSIPFLT